VAFPAPYQPTFGWPRLVVGHLFSINFDKTVLAAAASLTAFDRAISQR